LALFRFERALRLHADHAGKVTPSTWRTEGRRFSEARGNAGIQQGSRTTIRDPCTELNGGRNQAVVVRFDYWRDGADDRLGEFNFRRCLFSVFKFRPSERDPALIV
jgi:hypothetical protein